MASESKAMELPEEMIEAEVPVQIVARAAGPPRFKAPQGVVIRRGPMPDAIEDRLESLATLANHRDKEPVGDGVDLLSPVGPPKKAPRAPRKPGVMFELKEEEEGKEGKEEVIPEFTVDEALPEAVQQLARGVYQAESQDKVEVRPSEKDDSGNPIYKTLPTRRDFGQFIFQTFRAYALPAPDPIVDPDACAKASDPSKKEVKTFAYQSFIRDYMQKSSPYRGVLVYHGLGSGKTCTSIAAMESLYANKQRRVFILTPASLEPNYIDEITKCGPYIFRTDNHWVWVPVKNPRETSPELTLLTNVGIPQSIIEANRGAWLPEPGKESNFKSLSNEQKEQIVKQINQHIRNRFTFIRYNGLNEELMRQYACDSRMFDGATIVIDEVHNMIRSINNSNLEYYYNSEGFKESRSMATYKPRNCRQGAFRYRIHYLMYRMLCNAVGAKIIALSATPIINFPQELAILANILAGDTRMAMISSPGLDRKEQIETMLKLHPEVDFAEVIQRSDTNSKLIRVTPVPSGFRKVIDPKTNKLRGFVRDDKLMTSESEINRELNIEQWAKRISDSISKLGVPVHPKQIVSCTTRLPDLEKPFIDTFIDTDTLVVKESAKYALMARLSGLISYYKGGKPEYMAQEHNHLVELNMSGEQLRRYTVERNVEILREQQSEPAGRKEKAIDLVNKKVNSTFKIFSRACCNFAFPDGIDRPVPSDADTWGSLLTGEQAVKKTVKTAGSEDDAMIDSEQGPVQEKELVEKVPETAAVKSYQEALTGILTRMRAQAGEYFTKGELEKYSPKFQAILDRLSESKGPTLVYSNFKTLEGVGLFSVALEAQQGYKKFDIVKNGSKWVLSPETLASGPDTPRYISYTGDEEREKRNILLAIFNAKWSRIPDEKLRDAVKGLCGVDTNKYGKIARVIMITQSGAEGISLANVRQVHIMEPYWNYVRLEQVKGRAVRICSHADLPIEERSVDIFTYIVKFSEKQLTSVRGADQSEGIVDETIKNMDKGLTTDQSIYQLMQAKKTIADSLVDVMKKSAVDCLLNKDENGIVACYSFAGASSESYMFHPILEEHMKVAAAEVRGL
jgi:hypothetical protein